MSHRKIRAEKICLNCRTETPGRYCPSCGQENIEPKQSVWHLITHFFSDVTHFDGKFFITVKDLFAKPGFLSAEYMAGRRAGYLDPIRMYIFTSAFFFLIFFSLFDAKQITIGNQSMESLIKDSAFRSMLSKAHTRKDSLQILQVYRSKVRSIVSIADDSAKDVPGIKVKTANGFESVTAYDSTQQRIPVSSRDGWFARKFMLKRIAIARHFQEDPGGTIREWANQLMHNFPKILFLSLPAFALLLKLIYYRRKEYYYVDHVIFAIHLYIFTFLVLLVFFFLNELREFLGWGFFGWLQIAVLIYPLVYYYLSMRRFYQQGSVKTFWKYVLLLFLSYCVQLIIFTAAFIFSVFEA